MDLPPPPSNRQSAFTLIELIAVIAVLAVLAALGLPALSKLRQTGLVTKSMGNLRQIGAALSIYTGDNNGLVPGSRTNPTPEANLIVNNSNAWAGGGAGWWQMDLAPYLGAGMPNPGLGAVGNMAVFADPVFLSICGPREKKYFGGYAMNQRMGFPVYSSNPSTQGPRSDNTRTKIFNYPVSKTIFIGPGYYNEFLPQPNGTVQPERFSDTKSQAVNHGQRIGADTEGRGGRSALYLFLDGTVKELLPGTPNSEDPQTAAFYLRRR